MKNKEILKYDLSDFHISKKKKKKVKEKKFLQGC